MSMRQEWTAGQVVARVLAAMFFLSLSSCESTTGPAEGVRFEEDYSPTQRAPDRMHEFAPALQTYAARAASPGPGSAQTKSPVIASPAASRRKASPRIREELLVIEKKANQDAARCELDPPGTGSLVADVGPERRNIPVPLKHTAVDAQISGYVATVEVTQKFHNPFDAKIEARYVFPLPHNAAVNEFVMTIGDRRIRGIIRERKEAERIYKAARAAGMVASLLTQERPNIFTQSVANIEPGKEIDVEIRYFHTLAYADSAYEFVFPMVVGPRFNPPGWTDGVGAVSAGGPPGRSGQKTEITYLRPTERSGHDISLAVEVDAGVSIETIESPTHQVKIERSTETKARVRLSPTDSIPNRDFVLRYRVEGEKLKASVLGHRDERGGFFTLMVHPPEGLKNLPRHPMEFVFVLDCSGSMSGWPLARAKEVAASTLRGLGSQDTFQIIRFSTNASQLGPRPIAATPENIGRGLSYLNSLNSTGGTHMIEGIKAALEFPHDPERIRVVSFLTDGYIGNERQIFGAVHERLGEARIFSFGVGKSVNRHLLEGLARLGRGAATYVLGENEEVMRAVRLFYERVSHPALTDLEIDWGDMKVTQTFPSQLPDVFVGRPVLLVGRFTGTGEQTITLRGRAGGAIHSLPITVKLNDAESAHPGVASVWARSQLQYLSDQLARVGSDELRGEVLRVALEFGLVSAYTAFVAVDSSQRTAGDGGYTLQVPVPVPEGVRYETTVGK